MRRGKRQLIEYWYSLTDFILPFQWIQHEFMKNALLAVILVTPMFGLMGTMVVSNKMAFFSDSIGHSALTGIAIGVLLGVNNPLWAMIGFAVFLSILVSLAREANAASMDTIIGVFSSTVIALGIVILSAGGNFNRYSYFLIGDLLSITGRDIALLLFTLAAVLVYWSVSYNRLLVVSINRSLAASRGINVGFVETAFTVAVAVVVTISIQWVGILIINSLLVLPAAASRNIAANTRQYHVFSILTAVISGIAGLILSYYWGTATGATIVLVSAAFFVITTLIKVFR